MPRSRCPIGDHSRYCGNIQRMSVCCPMALTESHSADRAALESKFRRARAHVNQRFAQHDILGIVRHIFCMRMSTSGLIQTHFISLCSDYGLAAIPAASVLAMIGAFDFVGTIASGWLSDASTIASCCFGITACAVCRCFGYHTQISRSTACPCSPCSTDLIGSPPYRPR